MPCISVAIAFIHPKFFTGTKNDVPNYFAVKIHFPKKSNTAAARGRHFEVHFITYGHNSVIIAHIRRKVGTETKEVTTGLLRGPISNPPRPPLSPNWILTTPNQKLHSNLRPNGARYMVCTDSLWEHIIALPNSTIVDP